MPRTLSSDIKEKAQLPMDACASWGAVMADALEHMHQQGVVLNNLTLDHVIIGNHNF